MPQYNVYHKVSAQKMFSDVILSLNYYHLKQVTNRFVHV